MQGHIDVVAMPADEPRSMGPLGPMAGAWDGYSDLAPEAAMRAKALVGHIHAQAENCARAAIDIGLRLITLKELLPHGQFMACVKAEFGWGYSWTNQLMLVADRFSNYHSSGNLPSSAKVLALLAASGADDATVHQAADERWTVAETKRRIGSRKAMERTVVQQAVAALKLCPEALQLAAQAEHISTRQLMDELGVEEPPKGSHHESITHTFCKNGAGWWKFPRDPVVETEAQTVSGPEPEPESAPAPSTPAWDAAPLLSLATAAERLGIAKTFLNAQLTPAYVAKRNGAPLIRNGFKITREGRGMVRLTPVGADD